MLIDSISLRLRTGAKRLAMVSLACGLATATANAQVVHPASSAVRQVQAEILDPIQPPTALQPPPITPAPIQPPVNQPPGAIDPPIQPNQLNVDPNAPIDDLVPQAPAAPQAPQAFGGRQLGLGATAGAFSSSPTMIGDLFGGSFSTFGGSQTVPFSGYSAGTILNPGPGGPGGPGSADSIIAFEFGGDNVPNDIFTAPPGFDTVGGGDGADSFAIAEPTPGSNALTSPGPGFLFDGGTAVYTDDTVSTTPQGGVYQDGEQWFISYSYTQFLIGANAEGGRPLPGPGVAVRRVKLAENFSPEVRNRYFGSFNFFNDAFGGLGDIGRYVLGVERVLLSDLVSIEMRLPFAGTYASSQALDGPEDRDFEFGNAALIAKGVLLRNDQFIWSGGMGITLPLADDSRFSQGGRTVLMVKNETVHLLPFTALLYRKNRDTNFQAYMQLDIAAGGDPVFADLTGTSLPKIGEFNDSSLMHLDFAMSHVLYRNDHRHLLRQVIGNSEIHYSGTLESADMVQSNNINYTNLKRHFNVVNATTGLHLVLGDSVVVTPAMSVPLRDGLDRQFDFEAIVQLNYLR